MHRIDIIGDDLSSLASSSASVRSSSSNATVTLPQEQGQNPFNDPLSGRSGSSISGASVRSTSTASTLMSHLNNQRRPQRSQPPPLMGQGNVNTRPGADGRNRLVRNSGSSTTSSGSNAGSGGGSEAGSTGGRRLSRRASFFARLRDVGN